MIVRVNWERTEHTCFRDGQVKYTIEAELHLGTRGSYDDPPEPDEIHILEVVRFDPVDNEEVVLDNTAWPFTQDEQAGIEEKISSVGFEDGPDDFGSDDHDD